VLHFLPALPPTQTKPLWQLNPPSFNLHVDELLGHCSNRATTTSELPTCEYIYFISESAEDEGVLAHPATFNSIVICTSCV